jgi:septal ring factor EnvC (AmiA/AmiB activator)
LEPLAPDSNESDIARLESAVRALAESHLAQRDENEKLRSEIEARDRRIERLESELRRFQQSRRDVAQRIDALVAEIERLESRVAAPAPGA